MEDVAATQKWDFFGVAFKLLIAYGALNFISHFGAVHYKLPAFLRLKLLQLYLLLFNVFIIMNYLLTFEHVLVNLLQEDI